VSTGSVLAASPSAVVERRRTPEQLAGIGGLVFLALLIVQNLLKATTSPPNSATAAQIVRFAHHDAWTVDLLVVTYVVGFPCLFLYAAGVAQRCGELVPASKIWSRLGRSSVAVIAVLFGFVNIVQVVIVATRKELAADPALASTLWALHNAVFTINLVAVAGALLGLGRAATIARLVPRRLGHVLVAGSALLAVAAAPAVSEVRGSGLLAAGLVGFLCWLVLLGATSLRLLREGATAR
jgi:hypothetical protein